MTVRAALALPPIRRGQPELVAGADALERPIRWVASGDVAWIARDLKGGELLLTTGLGIGRRAREQRDYIDALCERSRIVTSAPIPAATRAACVPTTPPPMTSTLAGATPGTPPISTPGPPSGSCRK